MVGYIKFSNIHKDILTTTRRQHRVCWSYQELSVLCLINRFADVMFDANRRVPSERAEDVLPRRSWCDHRPIFSFPHDSFSKVKGRRWHGVPREIGYDERNPTAYSCTHICMQSRRSAGHLFCARQTALRNMKRMRSKREHCGIRLLSRLHHS